MPHNVLMKVWRYCTYNPQFLIFLFSLFFISEMLQEFVYVRVDSNSWIIFQAIVFIIVCGYGMEITRDRINRGVRLPKILIKDVLVLGIKSSIVMAFYLLVQGYILDFVCSPLNFPQFDLEEMILHWSQTLSMLYHHSPVNTIIFIVVGAIIFYCSSFFMEVALAKLADTGSIIQAFNFKSIKKSIDAFGWRNYAKDYTLIILAIVILLYLQSLVIPVDILEVLVDIFLGILIFATQYLGIGAVYCEMRDIETDRTKIDL